MINKFRKRPVVIEAIHYGGCPIEVRDVKAFVGNALSPFPPPDAPAGTLQIKTLEGWMNVSPGDFIIKGVAGEFYPCKPEIFYRTYDELKDGK